MNGWKPARIAPAIMLAAFLASCAGGTRPYVASSEENVRIDTVTKSGSAFSSVRASVNIYSVDGNCRTTYLGTIPLDRKSISTGIPAGKTSFLVFVFNSASFLGNRRASISYRTLVKPRKGYDYRVAVEYVDDTYNAEIYEVNRRGERRELRHRPLDRCRAGLRKAGTR